MLTVRVNLSDAALQFVSASKLTEISVVPAPTIVTVTVPLLSRTVATEGLELVTVAALFAV